MLRACVRLIIEVQVVGTDIIISIVTLFGSALGTFAGIVLNTKLTNYRIEQLEKKVDKHNCVVERMAIAENNIKVANHRLDDIERKMT